MNDDEELYDSNSVETIARLGREGVRPTVVDLGEGTKALAVPKGVEVQSLLPLLDELLEAPLESFIAHAKRFADGDSALFADPSPTAPRLTSVLDYHRARVKMAAEFVEKLRAVGHSVTSATFTHGAIDDFTNSAEYLEQVKRTEVVVRSREVAK